MQSMEGWQNAHAQMFPSQQMPKSSQVSEDTIKSPTGMQGKCKTPPSQTQGESRF